MKIKLDINSVAVKQLESAVWMYAYDFDEVAVHTIAAAAFELYSDRLKLSNFKQQMILHIKPDKVKDFHALWNKPYNFFKHGSHKFKVLDELIYDPELVEIVIYFACEANLKGPEIFRLSCAKAYSLFYLYKHPDQFLDTYYKTTMFELLRDQKLLLEQVTDKKTLRLWLDAAGHTFVNGTNTPFKPVSKS